MEERRLSFLGRHRNTEDLEIPLVSESTANKFNKKWKQAYLFYSILKTAQKETLRRVYIS